MEEGTISAVHVPAFSYSGRKDETICLDSDANSQEFRRVLHRLFPLSQIQGIFLPRQPTNVVHLAQTAPETIFYFKQLGGTYSVTSDS
jgi:hypothetical protein